MILFLLIIIIILISILIRLIFNNKIDKIYIINLKRRNDRLLFIKNNYNLNKPFSLIEAVDGREININELKKNKIIDNETLRQLEQKQRTSHYELTNKGSLGCYLSHYNIWKAFFENKDKIILIFEDDTIFNKITLREINKRLTLLPEDWDIYLLSNPEFCYHKIKLDRNLYKIKRFFLTNAYIINKRGVKKILESGTIFPINQQIDSYLSELALDFNLNIYSHSNYKYYEQSGNFGTDIQIKSINELNYDRKLFSF